MPADANVNIRTSSEFKAKATNVLARLGLDMSTAINLFLIQVVDKNAIPFTLTLSRTKRQAKLGGWAGKGWIADNFDDPMDDYGRLESDPNYACPIEEAWEK